MNMSYSLREYYNRYLRARLGKTAPSFKRGSNAKRCGRARKRNTARRCSYRCTQTVSHTQKQTILLFHAAPVKGLPLGTTMTTTARQRTANTFKYDNPLMSPVRANKLEA